MRRIVQHDFRIIIGGPTGTRKVLAVFTKGERLTLVRANKRGEYPRMYRIVGSGLGPLSRGVLAQFLLGMSKPLKKSKPEP